MLAGFAGVDARDPGAAARSDRFMLTWATYSDNGADVYGRRVSRSNLLEWYPGFWVGTGGASQTEAVTNYSFGSWLVAWRDYRSGTSVILATRTDDNGTPYYGYVQVVSQLDYPARRPSVATNDATGDSLIVWERCPGLASNCDVRGAVVDWA